MSRSLKVAMSALVVLVVAIVCVTAVFVWPWSSDRDRSDAIGGSTPGSVVSVTSTDLPLAMRLAKVDATTVEYISTDRTGRRTRVSGTVFEPGGDAPTGGWPIVAVGHGTTGINEECAPSRSDNLLGLESLAQGLVGSGFAVAIADYQGLGTDGVHPYLDSDTAGRNIIDSVRALRAVYRNTSKRWGGYGSSQGGGAMWAANEDASTYAPELDLVGTVDAAPVANVAALVDKSRAGTLTIDQGPALQWIIESAARAHPDIVRDDYRRGSATTNWDVLSACLGPLAARRDAAVAQLRPGELAPRDDAAARRLTDLLGSYALPRRAATAPMYVVFGDADTYIDSAWTRDAVRRACTLGDRLKVSEQPGKGHADVDLDDALPWLRDRFSGAPVESNC